MLVFNNQADLKEHLKSVSTSQSTIGFVPTMGALHKGHLSLIAQSIKENTTTVVSIFVNPTQFNNPEDLEKYPRTLEADIKIVKTLNPDVIIFHPSVEDIYNGNTKSEPFNFDGLENQMEGKHRPGHFDGVGTIVKRLFEIVKPNKAYFGEKDFQQLQIVKKMTTKANLPVTIIGCPILREESGLAMSSRNERLTKEAKKEAAIIYKILLQAKELFNSKSAKEVENWVETEFKKHTLFQLEYFEIVSEFDLLPYSEKTESKKARAFIAVFLNNIRLIDNISLN